MSTKTPPIANAKKTANDKDGLEHGYSGSTHQGGPKK